MWDSQANCNRAGKINIPEDCLRGALIQLFVDQDSSLIFPEYEAEGLPPVTMASIDTNREMTVVAAAISSSAVLPAIMDLSAHCNSTTHPLTFAYLCVHADDCTRQVQELCPVGILVYSTEAVPGRFRLALMRKSPRRSPDPQPVPDAIVSQLLKVGYARYLSGEMGKAQQGWDQHLLQQRAPASTVTTAPAYRPGLS